MNQSEPHNHATHAKRKPAKTQCFRRLFGRGRRTCLGCRLGRRWTVATGDQRPTTRTAGEPAGAPCCQVFPHTNEKSQVPHKRYLTFLAGAEGLEPSARGFGVDVGEHGRERGKERCWPILPDKSQKSGAGLVLRGKTQLPRALRGLEKALCISFLTKS